MIFSWRERKRKELAASLAEQSPVILMGRGHSGTRVLSFACNRLGLQSGVSETLATGDADDQTFTDAIKEIAIRNAGMTQLDQVQTEDLVRFQKAVAGYYERLGKPAGNWGWKFPETYLIAPYIALTFPKARYIHLVRDGRDLAFKRHLTDDPTRKLGQVILGKVEALSLPHHLQAAKSWAFQVDNYDKFKLQVAEAQRFELTFEQLCLQPHATMQVLSQFLGVPFTPACQQYLDTEVKPDKVGQYRENPEEQVKEIEVTIGATLKRYGYL